MLIYNIIYEIIKEHSKYPILPINTEKQPRRHQTLISIINQNYLHFIFKPIYHQAQEHHIIAYKLNQNGNVVSTCDTTKTWVKFINKTNINHPDFTDKIIRAYDLSIARYNERTQNHGPNDPPKLKC